MELKIYTTQPGEAPPPALDRELRSVFPDTTPATPVSERTRRTQQRREARRQAIWKRLYAAGTVETVEALLDEIEHLESQAHPPISREEIAHLRPSCLESLLELAGEETQLIQRLLRERLLPVCWRAKRDKPHSRTLAADVGDYWLSREPSQARDLLEKFIGRLPFEVAVPVREAAIESTLHVLRESLQSEVNADDVPQRRAQAALWTLSAVGFRPDEVTRVLLECIERPDEVGTVALATLISLGIPEDNRVRVEAALRSHLSRLSYRTREASGLGYALQEFATPSLFDAVLDVFRAAVATTLSAAWQNAEENPIGESKSSATEKRAHSRRSEKTELARSNQFRGLEEQLAASMVQQSMEQFPNETLWHERFWQTMWTTHTLLASLSGEPQHTFLSGDKIASCNVAGLARDVLTRLVPSYGDDPGTDRHAGSHFFRALILETMDKWVGEEQLRGLTLRIVAPATGVEEIAWVRIDALRSTGIKHTPFANSLSRHKQQAWRALLQLGYQPPVAWIETALRDETDAYTTGKVYEIVSCLRFVELPASVLKLVTEAYDHPGERPYDQFVARMSAQRLAASSGSWSAFESLLKCGLTMRGHTMAATVEHLSGIALLRHHQGDQRVVPALLKCAEDVETSLASHREVALGALRHLAVTRWLPSSSANVLVSCGQDETLRAYARALAVASIGFLTLDSETRPLIAQRLEEIFLHYAPEQFPARREKGEHELGWNASEAMVRLGAWQSIREPLLQRLGIAASHQDSSDDVKLRWQRPRHVNARHAFIAALIFQSAKSSKERQAWSSLLSDVVREGQPSAVFGVLHLLTSSPQTSTQVGTALPSTITVPDSIIDALCERIKRLQSSAQAETHVFAALVKLAPDRFISEEWERQWHNWLPDARVALAEALAQWAIEHRSQTMRLHQDGEEVADSTFQSQAQLRAAQLAETLSAEGLFAVRRSAYKALLEIGARPFWLRCLDWTLSSDVHLRRRAAEASAWLPTGFISPSHLRDFLQIEASPTWDEANDTNDENDAVRLLQACLSQDAEHAVRRAAKWAQTERRRRHLAGYHWDKVCLCLAQTRHNDLASEEQATSDEAFNRLVLDSYRYGRALIRVGEDTHLRQLRELLSDGTIEPALRSWLSELAEELESQWRDTTQKWPDPWLQWDGVVEELDGQIQIKDDWHLAHFTLRRLPGETPHEYDSWEGSFSLLELRSASMRWASFPEGELHIAIPGRRRASAYVTRSGTHIATLIRGNFPYPDPLSEGEEEQETGEPTGKRL